VFFAIKLQVQFRLPISADFLQTSVTKQRRTLNMTGISQTGGTQVCEKFWIYGEIAHGKRSVCRVTIEELTDLFSTVFRFKLLQTAHILERIIKDFSAYGQLNFSTFSRIDDKSVSGREGSARCGVAVRIDLEPAQTGIVEVEAPVQESFHIVTVQQCANNAVSAADIICQIVSARSLE
jgi:hypothetical protein